jgi:EmrB/QacA subfamily drug resistance transporter
MIFIDGTAVNVALPVLQRDVSARADELQWVIEGYALFLSALLLLGGVLGDRFGRRLIFGLGIALFAAASIACGLSANVTMLIAARCLQGVGGALATPGSLSLITAAFSGAERGRAIGTWSAASAMTAALGPLLGGWLTQTFSWRLVFFINIPLAILVLITLAFVAESRDDTAPPELDLGGAALATGGLGGLVYGLIGIQPGTPAPFAPWAIVAGIALLVGFVARERYCASPMVPPALFRSRPFTIANIYTFLLYGAMGGSLYFLPFDLINVQGYSPAAAGASLLPLVLIIALFSRFAGASLPRLGARLMLASGALLAAAGFALFASAGIGHPYWASFLLPILVLGAGFATLVAPLTTTVMDAGEAHGGVASGVNNAVSRVAGLIAVAALGIVLAAVLNGNLNAQLDKSGVSSATRSVVQRDRAQIGAGQVPPQIVNARQRALLAEAVRRAYQRGFDAVMLAAAGLALGGAALAWFGLRDPASRRATAKA